jgi:hypothetical protein
MSKEKEEDRRRQARIEEEKQQKARRMDELAVQGKKLQEEAKVFKKVEKPTRDEAQGAVRAVGSRPAAKEDPQTVQMLKTSPPQERVSKEPTKLEPENIKKFQPELAGKQKEIKDQDASAQQTLAIVNIKNVYVKDDINRFRAPDKKTPEQSANEVIGTISTGLIDFLRAEINLAGNPASSKTLNEVINIITSLHTPKPQPTSTQSKGFWASLVSLSGMGDSSGSLEEQKTIPRDEQISAYINKVNSILETRSADNPNLQRPFMVLKAALADVNPMPEKSPHPK